MNLLNSFKKKLPKVYDSIDSMPLLNWVKIHQKSDTRWVLVGVDYSEVEPTKYTDECFEKLYKEYFTKYLINKELLNYIELKKKIAILEAEAYLSNDFTNLTMAEIEQQRFDIKYPPKPTDSDFDIEKLIAVLERGLGFMIDREKMSVDSFYKHLTLFIESNGKKNKE